MHVCEDRITASDSPGATISMLGVIVPVPEIMGRQAASFKLVTPQGIEYQVMGAKNWRKMLSELCWEDVVVQGKLDFGNMSIYPEKIYPKIRKDARDAPFEWVAGKWRALSKHFKMNAPLYLIIPAVLAIAII